MMANSKQSRRWFWLPVAGLLGLHAALGVSAAARLTATHDEYWHLPVGLLNLKTGRFHYDNLNPPLCRMVAALPLLFTSAQTGPVDAARDPLGWGDAFVAFNGRHYDSWFFLGRTMIVLVSVLGGLATACWARELFGDRAGCLAALLWATEPNLLAHGSLVTTDMGAAAFFVLTMYALWRFAGRPGWTTAVVFGGVLGLAQLVKFTALILYPISVAALLVYAASGRNRSATRRADAARPIASPTSSTKPVAGALHWSFTLPQSADGDLLKRRPLRFVALYLVAISLSVAVLNAGYLFRGSGTPLSGYNFQSAALRSVAERLHVVRWLPLPVPRDYLEGLDHQRQVMEQKHPVFLDGQWSEDGFPHYYLWAMFYKLPHALQLLSVAALLWVVAPGNVPRRPWTQGWLLLPSAALIAAAEGSRMQLGIRYVLPAIPFLILFASQSAQWLHWDGQFGFKTFPFRAITTIALAGWMAFSVRYHPDHLAYFTELAGGPLGGREHLLDSNLDWGQDLGRLKRYLDARGIGEIGLAYFGTVPPASLGIKYRVPPSRAPQPGRFAVSVNFEQGRPHWLRTPAGEIRPVDIGEFGYFSFGQFVPVAHIGYSIDVFELTERDVAQWQSAVRQATGRP